MSNEDFVSRSIFDFLRESDWTIVHYHPPGGQAGFGVTLESKKFLVPDLIAVKDNVILIVENKSVFSISDVKKLRTIGSSVSAVKQIVNYTKRFLEVNHLPIPQTYNILLSHGYSGSSTDTALSDVILMNVDKSTGKVSYRDKRSLR
ncbi:hypothetical protein FIM08_01960 [SAR202 cluster bacterium AC-647-N09_OGT_505m]|nr:hypothetical protein [SAR202 cluster bacterium AC-647-N09_OGT_505m]